MNRRERSWLVWTTLLLILAANLPYLIASAATPTDGYFTGLVFNPIDGHSYLAKMRQGFDGSWRFHLAFTPERSTGAHIFLYHLALGHLARWIGLPLISVYHGARVLNGVAMFTAIYLLASRISDQRRERGTMFLLTALGSGVGWLVSMAGLRTADLWVPEAFPVYSLMANAHFPLAIALMALIGYWGLSIVGSKTDARNVEGGTWLCGVALLMAAVLLGAIQPFGLVPVFGALGIGLAARAVTSLRAGGPLPWERGAWIAGAGLVALAYPLYMQVAIRSDPILRAWNTQNVTGTPPLWDWGLSYGLISVLAVWGASAAIHNGSSGDFFLVGWALVTLVGMYLPLPLQRRLSIGLGIPMGFLAGMGWWRGLRKVVQPRARGLAQGVIVAVSVLSPIFLILASSTAALGAAAPLTDSWLYLNEGERQGMRWLRREAEGGREGVVLCSPQTGTFVPAYSGQRVVYGHPFETVDAERRADLLEAYWTGEMDAAERATFLDTYGVEYVLVGPRERALSGGDWEPATEVSLAFEAGDTQIYEVR